MAGNDLILIALRASCADVCSYAAPGAPGTGCYGECRRDLTDFNQDEIRNMQAVVQALAAHRGWRLVRFDHLATIMSLLPPPPLTQDGLTHRFEGPNPHDTIYAIRKVFAEMLGARPEQPFPSLSLQDHGLSTEKDADLADRLTRTMSLTQATQTIRDEVLWLERTAENYGGHPAETLRERAEELRAMVAEEGTK